MAALSRGPAARRVSILFRGTSTRRAVLTAAAAPPLQRVCRKCDGTLVAPCPACAGTGRLTLQGYSGRNNSVSLAKVVGTSWTALAPTLGRTHFHATATRALPTGASLVRLVATCDPSIVLWVPPAVLKARSEWAAGSLARTALAARRAAASGAERGAGAACRTCGGSGERPCPLCSAAGEVVEV